jgi:outer membrane lipoprotein SlyB
MNRRFALPLSICLFLVTIAFGQKAPEIAPGTSIKIRIIDNLTSETANIGDAFHGTLEEPLTAGGREVYPKGADVTGRVVDTHKSGRLSDPGELDLILSTVSSGNRTSSLHVQPLVIKGESHTKSNTTKIGATTVLGAIIGGIAGGGSGAAIGAGAGAAAGTGAAAATGKREAKVESEAVLTFVTVSAVEVTGTHTPGEATAASANAPATPFPSNGSYLFTMRDRRVIRNCISDHASELPPGTTLRAELPSGSERDLHRDGTVPSDLQKKLQSLPLACVQQLPNLPSDMERVVYSGHVMLIDSNNRILDIFDLE